MNNFFIAIYLTNLEETTNNYARSRALFKTI